MLNKKWALLTSAYFTYIIVRKMMHFGLNFIQIEFIIIAFAVVFYVKYKIGWLFKKD